MADNFQPKPGALRPRELPDLPELKITAVEGSDLEEITTVKGLKKELYTAVLRYFAPVVAIYEEFEKTAGISAAWKQRKLDEDRLSKE